MKIWRGQFPFAETMIAIAFAFAGIVTAFCVYAYKRTRASQTEQQYALPQASEWARQMQLDVRTVQCTNMADSEGYVSCTVLAGALSAVPTIVPVECSAAWTGMTGCRFASRK